MIYDELVRQIETARRCLASQEQSARASAEANAMSEEVREALASALEELHVASEELRQQNEELQAVQQEAEAERERYRDLFEFAPDGYLVTDAEGVIHEMNRAAAAMLRVTADFLAGKPLLVFVAREEHEAFLQLLRKRRAATQPELTFEVRLQPRQGPSFPAALRIGIVQDVNGHVTGLRWLLRDITEVKQSEAALRRANEELERRASENARLYSVEQSRRRQLEAVRAVTTEITRELDLQRLLQLIMRSAGELLDAGSATVWLWNESEQALLPHTWMGRSEWVHGHRVRLGEGLVGVVAERRQGMIVNDYLRWPHALPFVVERGSITAAIAEPLLYHDWLLGALAVDNEGTGRTFTQEDSDLLALFASHVAIALQNAQLFEQVRASRERLERLSLRLVEVQEAERRHVARELHDEIGQSLTGLKLIMDMSARGPEGRWRQYQADAQAVVNDLLSQVRELSLNLRPPMLDDLGLLPALVWYLERYRARTRVEVLLKHVGVEGRRFPAEVETAVFRTAQEALTNVARHANVKAATVRLWVTDQTLAVQVEDKGVGFDAEAAMAAHVTSGLSGMRERVGLLGGRLTVESAPGAGTCVGAELPLECLAAGG